MTAVKTIEPAQATDPLAQYVRQVTSHPVIVIENNKPIAAVIGITNADLETASLSTNPQFLALIERSRARLKAEGGISGDEMRRRLGLEKEQP